MQVEFLVEAQSELVAQIAWYERQRSGLGDRFAAEFWKTVDHVTQFPEAASEIAEGVRRKRLTTFPIGLVYVL